MRTVKVKELSLESFAPYGTFGDMINPDALKLGEEPIEFYRDMVPVDFGVSNIGLFSVCRVLKRPPVVDVTEYHSGCGEGNLPLDGDILIHVGPASANGVVPVEDFEVFRVPKGTFVSIKPGVWHHAPFAMDTDCVNTVIILPERTYANDCFVYEIPEDDQIQIEC